MLSSQSLQRPFEQRILDFRVSCARNVELGGYNMTDLQELTSSTFRHFQSSQRSASELLVALSFLHPVIGNYKSCKNFNPLGWHSNGQSAEGRKDCFGCNTID